MPPPPPDKRLIAFVAVTVTVIWALSVLLSVWLSDYQALLFTSPLMGGVVGYTTGVFVFRSGGGNGRS